MLHDTALYERAGKPAVALVTDEFKPQAAYQARMLGLDDAQVTWVQHPIGGSTQEAIHLKAERAIDSVLEQLTVAGASPLRSIAFATPTGAS